eukprot:5344261-Prymnesium_polylepis.1
MSAPTNPGENLPPSTSSTTDVVAGSRGSVLFFSPNPVFIFAIIPGPRGLAARLAARWRMRSRIERSALSAITTIRLASCPYSTTTPTTM